MATAESRSTGAPEPAAKATVVAPVPKKKKAMRAYLLLGTLALGAVGSITATAT